jgi:hypothetical protein
VLLGLDFEDTGLEMVRYRQVYGVNEGLGSASIPSTPLRFEGPSPEPLPVSLPIH